MRRSSTATLKLERDGSLAFSFAYDRAMVAALKSAVPYSGRQWDKENRRWLVAAQYEKTCRDLALHFLNVNLSPIQQIPLSIEPETHFLTLKYLGKAKDRGNGEETALGHDGAAWAQIYPISVLKDWFGIPHAPGAENTFYGVLGLSQQASVDEVKKAYRKMARIWHPDVCGDPDATEQFQRINEAHSILSDTGKRARYDAGLVLESSLNQPAISQENDGWRPPLRCGYLLAEGKMQLGRFVISEIKQWTDIVNSAGLILSTSWTYGDDSYTERWV